MRKYGRIIGFTTKMMTKEQLYFIGEIKLDNKFYDRIVKRLKILEDRCGGS